MGAWKSVRMATSAPSRARIRDATLVASSEWPPRSKKLSSMPTAGSPRTSAKISQSATSRGLRPGSCPETAADGSGAGRALRSTFPLGVRGSASRVRNALGSM